MINLSRKKIILVDRLLFSSTTKIKLTAPLKSWKIPTVKVATFQNTRNYVRVKEVDTKK